MSDPAFGARLRTLMDDRGPLCVGIDPHAALLSGWGLSDDPAGLEAFAAICVEALAETVAVLKPQSAFFERHGSAGIAVLEGLVREARRRGALVLLDVKRGDIGSTMQGYADAYLDPRSPIAVDAVTVSPYLGFESLRPMLDTAALYGAGVFVLALTSNPEGPQVQGARVQGARVQGAGGEGAGAAPGTVAGEMLAAVRGLNADTLPMGAVGAVVAANLESLEEDLAINGPLLAPGFGAQGGTPAHLRATFDGVLDLVLPSSSRDVLRAGPSVPALRAAAVKTADEVAAALQG